MLIPFPPFSVRPVRSFLCVCHSLNGGKGGGGHVYVHLLLVIPICFRCVQAMMKAMNLPKDLSIRIKNYYDYYNHRHKAGIDTSQVFFDLSTPLVKEIALCLHCAQVQNTPLFQGCQPHFLVALVQKLFVRIFLPGDYIIVIGQFAQEMYFIRTGKVPRIFLPFSLSRIKYILSLESLKTANIVSRCSVTALTSRH